MNSAWSIDESTPGLAKRVFRHIGRQLSDRRRLRFAMKRGQSQEPALHHGSIIFLHIGKTGGTALISMLREQNRRTSSEQIVICPHRVTLPKALEKSLSGQVVFFVREPQSRFVSMFNSRLRQGLPHHYNRWNSAEREMFSSFRTPNELAEALGHSDVAVRERAERAMRTLQKRGVGHPLAHVLVSPAYLESVRDRLLYVGTQHTFDADVAALKGLLQIGADLHPPKDDVGAHRTPPELSRDLSAAGAANIRAFYSEDYEIYNWCLKFRRLHGKT